MAFSVSSLPRERFEPLFGLDDEALARRGMKRYIADKKPGFPCRVSLRDAEPGERVILVPFEHLNGISPYQAHGPIFVRESAEQALLPVNTLPPFLSTRLLSVRAYDKGELMVDADVVDGPALGDAVVRLLGKPDVAFLHVHFARPGCYACRVDRA